MVIINRFSVFLKIKPLLALPNALETAKLLFEQIFRNNVILEDILSDHGPQFTSRVWKASMDNLGVTVSLTSGYHPQSNGQVKRLNYETLSPYLLYK